MSEVALKAVPAPDQAEAKLIERAQGGDHGAYELLVRRHQQAAFRAALLIVRSAADAEDVAQEAFVKAYRALARFRRGAPFRPWLLRIVGNEARNHRRSAGRREFHQLRALTLAVEDSPVEAVLRADERRRVVTCVERLPDAERTAIVARYFAGLSDAEAAALLRVPRATVKMRAWRGLQRLRRELGDAG